MNRVKKESKYWEAASKEKNVDDYIADPNLNKLECVKRILPYIKECKKVVEIGSGVGRLTFTLANKIPKAKFIGVDISEGMVKIANKRLKKLKDLKNVKFICNDGRKLPNFRGVDGAYSMITFQHIDEEGVKSYFNQISKLFKNGGIFRFQYVEGDEKSEFSQQYKQNEIVDWLYKAGFQDIEVKGGDLYSNNWRWVTARK